MQLTNYYDAFFTGNSLSIHLFWQKSPFLALTFLVVRDCWYCFSICLL